MQLSKRKMYSKKLSENDEMAEQLKTRLYYYSKQTYRENDAAVNSNIELTKMLLKETTSPLTGNNAVKLLMNGEEKFPEVLQAMH
jgi:cardiolipin synthase